jgi:hypothetical protein
LQKSKNEGIITKVDWSGWASPVVAVPKANRLVRLCGDFNPELKVDQYPVLRIEDIFANLAACEKFTKIDMRQAYLQLETEEESKKYLTVNTHKGLYQYNRKLFGVASEPVWQGTIDQILHILGTQVILDALRELATSSRTSARLQHES